MRITNQNIPVLSLDTDTVSDLGTIELFGDL
jgi:hypothetical protein